MSLTRRVTVSLLAVALALTGAAGITLDASPAASVRAQAETGVPEDLSEAALENFDFSSVFVDLEEAGESTFSSYRYPLEGEDGALVSAFLGVLDSQVGGFVVPDDECSPDVVAPFEEQQSRSVTAEINEPDAPSARVPVALVVATVVDPEVQASAAYQEVWQRCLRVAAEETTEAAEGSVKGLRAFNLFRENREGGTPIDLDLVTWSEEGLELMVFSTFALVDDGAVRRFLETRADTVEPGLEIARVIAARTHRPTDLLVQEATAPIPLGYGDPVPGVEARVKRGLREGFDESGAAPELDPALLITRAEEFQVGPDPLTLAQVVVWDPTFLNRPGFRTGWIEGLQAAADVDVVTEDREGARVYARYAAEGLEHAAWIAECYTFTVSGVDAAVVEEVADEALAAQIAARLSIFGIVGPVEPAEGEDAEAARDERNRALCSPTNLRLFQTGFPVDDADGDGIADRVEDQRS